MKTRGCDRAWEADAVLEGRLGAVDAESFLRHRRTCAACDELSVDNERIRELTRLLPQPDVDEVNAKRLRARILRDAATLTVRSTSPRLLVAAFAVVAAMMVVASAGAWRAWRANVRDDARSLASTWNLFGIPTALVTPEAGSVFAQTRFGARESVRLVEGTISLSVPHREAQERFVVVVPDGEIEVRGTTFSVSVESGRTTRVHVVEGVVSARLVGRDEVVLRANEEWPAMPSAIADLQAKRLPTKAATPPLGPSSSPTPRVAPGANGASDPTGYARAIELYRGHHYDEAARAFRAFAAAHGGAAESEDAAFLEAVCLARAGRADAAAVVAERFLERYPRSFHSRDAAMLIARAARDGGDCEKSRRIAAPWLVGNPSADWVSALGACLPPR